MKNFLGMAIQTQKKYIDFKFNVKNIKITALIKKISWKNFNNFKDLLIISCSFNRIKAFESMYKQYKSVSNNDEIAFAYKYNQFK